MIVNLTFNLFQMYDFIENKHYQQLIFIRTIQTSYCGYYSFPKNPVIRQKWINACGLSINDELKYIFICIFHFAPEDVENGNEMAKARLKKGAVPSINVPNPNDSDADETIESIPEVRISSVGCQNYSHCHYDEIQQENNDITCDVKAENTTCKHMR